MLITLAERHLIPDLLVRAGIRTLLGRRLREEYAADPKAAHRLKEERIEQFAGGSLAVAQQAANEQHYEVPAAFYRKVLGPHLKYSSAFWPEGVTTLAEAEQSMLRLTCERAQLEDGQRVLELGCGWGSLTLWMAAHYPRSEILAVSNSASQKAWIDNTAAERGLTNVRVITADVAEFQPDDRYHRVVSVEMFEHMRNHRRLLERVADWLLPDGRLFVHIFCHQQLFYPFEDQGQASWMARTFFTGGVMPSFDLLERCQSALALEQNWQVNGNHYARTLEAWLENADARREELLPILRETYGDDARLWLQRWRMFFMACAELFRYGDGKEWFVGHYLFRKAAPESP